MGARRRKRRASYQGWPVSKRLEAVQARERGLTSDEIRSLYGVSRDTLRRWRKAYEEKGIAGLEMGPRIKSVELSPKVEAAERVLEQLKPEEPEAGIGKMQGALYRHGFLDLARETVRKLLRRKGMGPILGRKRRRNRPAAKRFFERANPNELWQSDIMSFMLKGQYRVYLIAFLDDHSRFIVGWGLYRFQTSANVLEVFRAAIEKHGMPKEVLTDNGRQYYTWRGRSQFTKMLTKLGIRHIRSRPYHPQTLGKIESFWRNLLQERLTQVPLDSFEKAKDTIGEYVEYYCFKRPHQGIGNVMPSDRFYGVAGQVRQIVEKNTEAVQERQAAAPEYTPPAYLVGNLGGKELRVVAKDAEVTLKESVEEKVESGPDGKEDGTGGSPGIPPGEKIDPGANAGLFAKGPEAKNVEIVENQAPQPAGKAGADPAGPVPEGAHQEPVSSGGGVEGAVLPVDERGEGGQSQGAGGEGAGAEGDPSGGSTEGAREGEGADPEAGEGDGETTQGAGPREAGGASGATDHPASGVGPGAPSEA